MRPSSPLSISDQRLQNSSNSGLLSSFDEIFRRLRFRLRSQSTMLPLLLSLRIPIIETRYVRSEDDCCFYQFFADICRIMSQREEKELRRREVAPTRRFRFEEGIMRSSLRN